MKRKLIVFLIIFMILIPSFSFAMEQNWGLEFANIPYAWDKGITGKGVNIAIIDSGFADLPELELETLIEFEEITKTSHGTAQASIIREIAPDAKIYALAHGGKWQGIEKALKWCLKNDIDVINMSIGGYSMNSYLRPVHDLAKQGVLMVASAGNEDVDEYYPAFIDGVYSIGAVNLQNGNLVNGGYNNQSWNDFIFSTKVAVYNEYGGRRIAGGTSSSSPGVAGLFALLKQEYPNASNNKLFNLLTENGIKVKGVTGIFPVYPISDEEPPTKPNPTPEPTPKPDDSDTINESREALDEYIDLLRSTNRQLDRSLLNLLMKISEIDDLQLREKWFNKVLSES